MASRPPRRGLLPRFPNTCRRRPRRGAAGICIGDRHPAPGRDRGREPQLVTRALPTRICAFTLPGHGRRGGTAGSARGAVPNLGGVPAPCPSAAFVGRYSGRPRASPARPAPARRWWRCTAPRLSARKHPRGTHPARPPFRAPWPMLCDIKLQPVGRQGYAVAPSGLLCMPIKGIGHDLYAGLFGQPNMASASVIRSAIEAAAERRRTACLHVAIS